MQTNLDALRITLLGAGQEVGRSCCVLQSEGKTIVCDAGIHPAYSGIASLPFLDELDWSTVDAVLITHFHLDHAGALTYITEKTNFREGNGKVYMTYPTKVLHKLMMQDYLCMSSDALFTSKEVSASLASIIPISVHERIDPCPGISFISYHAGHVLGACMYLIDVGGLKILYTGDYSRTEDRHLVKAEVPAERPEVLIVESTFGVHNLESEREREASFTTLVHSIVKRGGHVLLPVFALGTAQELLLVLDEYWAAHPELHGTPVYYASSLAKKCMAVYQTHIHSMNENIRSKFARRDNPFVFKHVSSISREKGWEHKIAGGPPCVVLASPGFMQTGASRALFELWAPDHRNGIIVTGFSVEGTLTRDIIAEPDEIISLRGTSIPRRLTVHYIPFSAHVDFSQNAEFIELVGAEHVVLVHGERNTQNRLCDAMTARYKSRGQSIKLYTPKNLETLQLSFPSYRIVKAVGTLAAKRPEDGDAISGVLVSNNYCSTLLNPQDLPSFTGLSTNLVRQRQRVMSSANWDMIRWHLGGMFGVVEERLGQGGVPTLRVMGVVDVKRTSADELTIEWDSTACNDMIADSTLALVAGVDQSPASLQFTTLASLRAHPHARLLRDSSQQLQRIVWFLEAHFGEVNLDITTEADRALDVDVTQSFILSVRSGEVVAYIKTDPTAVTCVDDMVKSRVEDVINMAILTTYPLSDLFDTSECMHR